MNSDDQNSFGSIKTDLGVLPWSALPWLIGVLGGAFSALIYIYAKFGPSFVEFADEATVIAFIMTVSLTAVSFAFSKKQKNASKLLNEKLTQARHLTVVANFTSNSVTILSADRKIVWINAGFERLTGYTSSEVIGKSPIDILKSTSTDLKIIQEISNRLIAAKPFYGEIVGRHKNGKEYGAYLEIQCFYDVNKCLEGYLLIEFDITEQWRSRLALINERKRLSDILEAKKLAEKENENTATLLCAAIDAVNEAFVLYDPQDRIVFCNEKFRDIYSDCAHLIEPGLRFEDFLRAGLACKQYPQAEGAEDQWIEKRLLQHHGDQSESVHRLKNDRIIRLIERKMSDGHTVEFHFEITELVKSRELAEFASHASEKSLARLQAVYDILPVGLTIADKNGYIIDCNPASKRLLSIAKGDHLNHHESSDLLVLNEDGSVLSAKDDIGTRVLKDGMTIRDHVIQVVRSKKRSWLSISAMPVQDKEIGAIITYTDITEQRDQNQALLEAKALAEQASQAKSQFLANMSHEIRTPMNAVLGMLSLLRRTELTPRQMEYTVKTEGAARSLLGLLNDILDFSKVEAGKMNLDLHTFEVDEILQSLSVILSISAAGKRIEVLYELDSNLPKFLIGDSLRLQQILINLGGNAIKFTKQGEVVIALKCLNIHDGQVNIEFSVRDTGIGIALENQQKIFEGFTQAEASTTRQFGGTGLGVAICQRLIRLMGGELNVDSELGKGSCFYFDISLPIAHEHTQENLNLKDGLATRIEIKNPSPIEVLIVDDSATARRSLENSIKSLGWQSQCVDCGEKAVELVRNSPGIFDLILVDWTMPGMNGWQTCRALRELGHPLGRAKIFMVTAQSLDMLGTRSQEERQMLSGFVVKPVTAKMLQDAWTSAVTQDICGGMETRIPIIESPQRLHGLRILIAEDSPSNQQVIRELLEDEGATIDVVNNGLAAVVALTESVVSYDVILMDMQMPVMDGIAATRKIREELGKKIIPIVAMTANATSEGRHACIDAGMNEHIGKPFDLDHLVKVILKVTLRISEASLQQPKGHHSVIKDTLEDHAEKCGIDLYVAIQRIGGNWSAYYRLLKTFLAELDGTLEEIRQSFSKNDNQLISRQIHIFSGLCGTLGLNDLVAISANSQNIIELGDSRAIEQELRMIMGLIYRIKQPLQNLCDELSGNEFENSAHISKDEVCTASILEAIEKLKLLLADMDMESINVIEHLRTLPWGPHTSMLSQIDENVSELKFEDALVKCQIFIDEHQTS